MIGKLILTPWRHGQCGGLPGGPYLVAGELSLQPLGKVFIQQDNLVRCPE